MTKSKKKKHGKKLFGIIFSRESFQKQNFGLFFEKKSEYLSFKAKNQKFFSSKIENFSRQKLLHFPFFQKN